MARTVAKGFRQVEGVDYDETCAPTIRFESVTAPIALAAAMGRELEKMDHRIFVCKVGGGDISGDSGGGGTS